MTYQQELKNQRIKNVQDTVEKMVNEYGVKETTNPTQKKNGTRQFLFPGGASLATYKSGYVRRIGGYGDWQINNVVKTTQIYYYVIDKYSSYTNMSIRFELTVIVNVVVYLCSFYYIINLPVSVPTDSSYVTTLVSS